MATRQKMKLQYLGNAKDSFKWDYHDFVMSELKYPLLNIVLMMTPDDGNNGKTPPPSPARHPRPFPVRDEITKFCECLEKTRSIDSIKTLPRRTKVSYMIRIHKDATYIRNNNRNEYFSELNGESDQVLFIDPDTGFEPKKLTAKHVGYKDIARILEQVSDDAVVSVFQNNRRRKFPDDFKQIQNQLRSEWGDISTTAICWGSVMFVTISKSKKAIEQVKVANEKYERTRSAKITLL